MAAYIKLKELRIALLTLGCKVNQYETDAMKERLEMAGGQIVGFHEAADIYIVNTCSVTNVADKKSRQMLHRAKRKNPEAVIVAAGCYVQAAKDELQKDALVDIIIGNNKKNEIVEILSEYFASKQKESRIIDINHTSEFEEMDMSNIDGHTRAYIKVQDGCNQFCSYCIIPYTRGRVRSRKMEEIEKEIVKLTRQGYKEFVLTGIHLSSYGVDMEQMNLLILIQKIAQVDGVERIRLGSLEPRIITEEFIQEVKKIPSFCPHFHLSLQSACNDTLRRMNRKYTIEEYMEKCDLLRRHFDHPAITTDVIVGFPGETEEEFAKTVEHLEEIQMYEMHIFKYSKRKGTRAEKMPDQVDEQKKNERSAVLLAMTKKQKKAYEEALIGTKEQVLLEESIELDGTVYFTGHTKRYVKIGVRGENLMSNQLVNVKIDGFSEKDFLVADLISK